MYVGSFGYGTSAVVETKSATETFAVKWRVKLLNCLGLTDIILRSRTITHQVGRESENPNVKNERSSEVLPDEPFEATEQCTTIRSSCRDRWAQCWIDEMDCSTRSLAHFWFQEQRCTVPVPSCDRWSVSWKGAGFGESVLAHLPEMGNGSGNPAPKLADRWKSAVWLGSSDFTDEHLVRTDEGRSTTRRAQLVRGKPSNSCRSTTEAEVDDIGHSTCSRTSCSPLAVPEVDEGEKDEPTEKPAEDGEVQLEPPETTMAPGASSSRRETHRNTGGHFREEAVRRRSHQQRREQPWLPTSLTNED